MIVLSFVFWASAFWVVYVYLLYPLLVSLLPGKPLKSDKSHEPNVTVIIPAYNEATVIEATIRNKLDQTYPAEKMEILIVSDESTDGTDDIVEALAAEDSRVKLLRQSPRQGKTAGVNRAVKQAKGDILIFSDANSLFAPDAITHLTASFSDPAVGYVTGKMVYVNQDGSMVGDGCSAYMKYENFLRSKETRVGSVVGVDGGIDAMCKSLYQPLRADQLPDFVQPLKVVEQGYRVVYQEEALLKEDSLNTAADEQKMRVRVSLRALWALWDMKHLLNPLRYPLFSWQLWSHKVFRYLAFLPLMAALPTNLVLVGVHPFYVLTLLIQACFYLLALFSPRFGDRLAGVARLPYYFCLINLASAHASLLFVRKKKIVTWTPRTN
ncbi:MAG: glycosyltransferase family 2 protein [Natronospirillum sp.]|uniref:glycosyltransferase family 2 protein n=1 Tax=Natronospirillum sp. TaxID=2812955 RepID=UPI0025E7B363|nr:glycosyltransferase family 2 protein [Natronospirillum sp.]MCH8551561.1 glycosyltransferase family 2 protein [Natronospirillum sp.]